jgi:hypothetical protein
VPRQVHTHKKIDWSQLVMIRMGMKMVWLHGRDDTLSLCKLVYGRRPEHSAAKILLLVFIYYVRVLQKSACKAMPCTRRERPDSKKKKKRRK